MGRQLVHSAAVIFLCVCLLMLPACQNEPEPQDETPTPPSATLSPTATPQVLPSATPLPAANPEPGSFTDSTVQPEIQALAAGLDYEPRLIYEYVLNHYDVVPVLGQMKSARDTFLSRRGNPFDLAVLLSDLLRAAGYETEMVFGIIELPLEQAMNWVGAETPEVLYHVLDSGGIYNEVGEESVMMKHIWVRVRIHDTWYTLDPALKEYAYSQGIDLAPILGYRRDAYLAAAFQGSTVTADYVRGVNSTNIDAQLTQYAAGLVQYLRQEMPFASLQDVIGGRSIVPQTVDALPEQVPYTVARVLGTFSELPAELQYRLHVVLPGVDYTVPLPEVAGERITITYAGASDADRRTIEAAGGIEGVYPASEVQMVPELRIGGTLAATGDPAALGSTQEASLSVITPYSIGDNPVVWQARSKQLQVGAVYAYPLSLEGMSEEALNRHNNLVGDYRTAGSAEDSAPVLGESLYLIGASYASEIESIGRLDAALAGVVFVPQFLAAWVSQDLIVTEVDTSGAAQRVAWGSYNIDVSMGRRTVRSASGNGTDARAFNTHLEYRASAAEHAILEQLQGVPAWSTVKALGVANDQSVRIYHIDAGNIDAVLASLQQPDWLKERIRQLVSEGRVVVIPEQRTRYNDYQGSGFWSYDPASGVLDGIISGGLVYGAAGSFPQTAQNMQTPLTMGGSSTQIIEISIEDLLYLLQMGLLIGTGCNQGCNNPDPNAENNAGADPVDTATGAFLHQTTDFSFGSLGFPIAFTRTYSSERRNTDGALGYGWTHNYVLRMAVSSEWGRSLGYRTALDAAAAIAESYVGIDLARAPEEGLSAEQLLAGTMSAAWSTSQVIQNVVTISGFNGENHQYLRLPDGSFQPGHHDYSTLTMNADRSYTLADKAGNRVEFDAQGHCLALVDANDNRTVFTYNSEGLLTQVTDAAGRSIQLSYSEGRLAQIADPAGNLYQYTYDPAGNLAGYTDPLGGSTLYTYDAQHRLVTLTDAAGVTTITNTYDAWSRVTQQVDGRGGALTIRYGDIRSVAVNPLGMPTIYEYDAYQRLVGQEDALQNRTAMLHDANDNVLQVSDRLGNITRYAYDARGNLVSITDPLGNRTLNEYDEQNNLIMTTDRTGASTQYAYDANHNLIQQTDALGGVTSFSYDERGLLTSMTNARGFQRTFEYDTHGNLSRSTDALGHAETRTYDILGRSLTYTDGAGNTSETTYDPAGHVLQVANALGQATTFTYDGNGMLLSVTDPRGSTTQYAYDGQYALIQVTDALGNVTEYELDLNGQLVTQTDANGNATHYTRDPLGRIVCTTDPLGRQVVFTYDANGNLLSSTRADGRAIAYQYDALGRLIRVDYPDGNSEVWEYDAEGRVTGSSYDAWQAQYTRDALGRVRVADLAQEGVQVAYAYDLLGNRVEIDATRGGDPLYGARYVFDAANRLTEVSDVLSGYAVAYEYYDDNTLAAMRHSSGVQANFLRDAAGRITGLEYLDGDGQVRETVAYAYDAAGNLTSELQDGIASLSLAYEYDALNRLVSEERDGVRVEYAYDAAGNRTAMTDAQGRRSYTYDAADQLLSAGEAVFTYDANGNQVARTDASGTYTLAYDDRNLLVEIINPAGESTTYAYDAYGLLVAVEDGSGTQRVVRDGYLELLTGAEDFGEGQAYLWGAGQRVFARPLGSAGAEAVTGYLGDGLGNVAYFADGSGTLAAAGAQDAFGRWLEPSGEETSILFQGMLGVQTEPALEGIYRMGHRYYDASSGRFLTRDRVPGQAAQPQTLNRYAYALANPLRYVDPWGLSPNQNQTGEALKEWLQAYFQAMGYDLSQVRVATSSGSSGMVSVQMGAQAFTIGSQEILSDPNAEVIVHEVPHTVQQDLRGDGNNQITILQISDMSSLDAALRMTYMRW